VVIDPRKSEKPAGEPARVWITGLARNRAVDGLWEAEIVEETEPGPRLLRLNADPPAHLRPSKRTRAAVSRVYESALFPSGLDAAPEQVPAG
jgi:hypothetical protein